MSDMVTRAGDAVMAALKRPFGDFPVEQMHEPWNVVAGRMVLLAALDPSETEVAAIVAAHNAEADWLIDADELRACVSALKAWVQVGSVNGG